MTRLEGKRVLMRGASSGVGLAAVEHFAREGAELSVVARGGAALEQAAAVAREHGVAAHVVVVADLADERQGRPRCEAHCHGA